MPLIPVSHYSQYCVLGSNKTNKMQPCAILMSKGLLQKRAKHAQHTLRQLMQCNLQCLWIRVKKSMLPVTPFTFSSLVQMLVQIEWYCLECHWTADSLLRLTEIGNLYSTLLGFTLAFTSVSKYVYPFLLVMIIFYSLVWLVKVGKA